MNCKFCKWEIVCGLRLSECRNEKSKWFGDERIEQDRREPRPCECKPEPSNTPKEIFAVKGTTGYNFLICKGIKRRVLFQRKSKILPTDPSGKSTKKRRKTKGKSKL